MVWRYITYKGRVLLGSTSFLALTGYYLSSNSHLKKIRHKYIKVNIKPARKILSLWHTVCVMVWGYITHVEGELLDSAKFLALTGYYLSSYSHLKRIRDKNIKVNTKLSRKILTHWYHSHR